MIDPQEQPTIADPDGTENIAIDLDIRPVAVHETGIARVDVLTYPVLRTGRLTVAPGLTPVRLLPFAPTRRTVSLRATPVTSALTTLGTGRISVPATSGAQLLPADPARRAVFVSIPFGFPNANVSLSTTSPTGATGDWLGSGVTREIAGYNGPLFVWNADAGPVTVTYSTTSDPTARMITVGFDEGSQGWSLPDGVIQTFATNTDVWIMPHPTAAYLVEFVVAGVRQ